MSISIDVTDYVSAPKDQATLLFHDERQQANFELGVSMHIHKWDTLSIAVDNGWGGQHGEEKRDWITGVVVDLFRDNKELDVFAIHEVLFNAMEDEFEVFVEDDTTVLVAHNIVNCYRDCARQDYTKVQEMYARWQIKQANRSRNAVAHVHVEEDPENPESSDDEEDEDHTGHEHAHDDDVDMDVDEVKGPIVDEDGFTVVTKKGGRRR
ncbi:unnamed protein product [Kuraishia capsulata CBS 1993]|uniref:Pre-rRNA-processing protein TSR2 n=1 Tax=Kuraishia capsulata CBS 1993 TaxID=1382522 RepID=W6MIM7_9ASCO|nr:uncharacterized protein KUCA_T00000187001 [Kuraishia capsulata CBS 1993]CDK24227.1 unnamed protein product [Kuraishia capsulata CBS 1993]